MIRETTNIVNVDFDWFNLYVEAKSKLEGSNIVCHIHDHILGHRVKEAWKGNLEKATLKIWRMHVPAKIIMVVGKIFAYWNQRFEMYYFNRNFGCYRKKSSQLWALLGWLGQWSPFQVNLSLYQWEVDV